MKVAMKQEPIYVIECTHDELRYLCSVVGRTSMPAAEKRGFDGDMPMGVYHALVRALDGEEG